MEDLDCTLSVSVELNKDGLIDSLAREIRESMESKIRDSVRIMAKAEFDRCIGNMRALTPQSKDPHVTATRVIVPISSL